MSPTLTAVAGIGLLLGFRHAFEPDHLAAVSTLASRSPRLSAAAQLGLAWALGHTASVAAVVLTITAFGLRLPESLWPAADFLVALLLISLGLSVITRYARGRWHLHAHSHGEGEGPHLHLHLHSHAHGASHAHVHPQGDARRAFGFGVLHGLAGSTAILLLLVAAAKTRGAQLAYFAAFGVGTLAGMLVVSLALAAVVRLASQRGTRWATVLHVATAVTSVVVGFVLAGRVVSGL
ncbi:MAG: sulfite exporter TauE/SafE family protein [Gemmatimonadetes bacterium]|nr:sulfite exporter TauE/SafE family protein [Gemmatimonadota bacterium]